MLLSNQINILVNKGNLPFYKKIEHTISIGDIISIDIEKISKGSNKEIKAKCDICNKEVKISYKLYNRRVKKNGIFACSKKCAAIRTKEKLQKEYGVSNISQVPYVKEKIKQTNLERYGNEYFIGSNIAKYQIRNILIKKYGVDNPQKNEEIKEKTKKTNLKRYGSEFTLSVKNIRDVIKKTNLEKYGYEQASKSLVVKNQIKSTNQFRYDGNSPMCDDGIKKKSKDTLLLNWGVDNPQKNEEIKEKTKKTNLDRYGNEYPIQNESVVEKRRENNIIKWGKPHVSQSDDFRNGLIIGSSEFYIKYIGDKISLFRCDGGKDHNFEILSDNFHSRMKNNTPLCTICNPIGDSQSIKEKELFRFINSVYDGKITQSYRDGLEIDIYLPELKIGFEFNGLYWHSEEYKDRNYHLDKTNYFKEKGIRIIHIWEDDWTFKRNIIESQIKNWVGLTDKIGARKCDIRELSPKISSEFLDKNHIQGRVGSSVKIGLYYNNTLVSLMTFDHFEGRKKLKENEWNLSRFCNLLNTSVIGGFSKLLKYFIDDYQPKRIISYSDKDWSIGNIYLISGFNKIIELKPDYKYIISNKKVGKSRFRKSRLGIENIRESEYMKIHDIKRIYNCGKIKFEKLY